MNPAPRWGGSMDEVCAAAIAGCELLVGHVADQGAVKDVAFVVEPGRRQRVDDRAVFELGEELGRLAA